MRRLALCRSLLAAQAKPLPIPETQSPPPSASGTSTVSDQSPNGAEPVLSRIEPQPNITVWAGHLRTAGLGLAHRRNG